MTTSLDVSRKLDQISMDLLLAVDSGNEERLYAEHAALLDEADFDFDTAGARILGRDLASIAGSDTRGRLEQILNQGMDRAHGEPLLRALPLRYEEARRLVEALTRGLHEGSAS